jgi:hypothetical protein
MPDTKPDLGPYTSVARGDARVSVTRAPDQQESASAGPPAAPGAEPEPEPAAPAAEPEPEPTPEPEPEASSD